MGENRDHDRDGEPNGTRNTICNIVSFEYEQLVLHRNANNKATRVALRDANSEII